MPKRHTPSVQEVFPPRKRKRELLRESFIDIGVRAGGISFLTAVGLAAEFLTYEDWRVKLAAAFGIGLLVIGAQWVYHFGKAFGANRSTQSRESANGYLLVALKRCFDGVHAAYQNDGRVDSDEFLDILKQFCQALHTFYTLKTTAEIGVSIKLFTPANLELVDTIARNEKAAKRYDESFDKFEHRVADSTAFNYVMSGLRTTGTATPQKLCYVNYDIEADYLANKYVNSSINYLHASKGTEGRFPLSYRSELVIPIIPPLGTKGQLTGGGTAAGFLCIDIDEKNTRAFDLAYEFDALLGVGHGIFLLSQMLNQDSVENLP